MLVERKELTFSKGKAINYQCGRVFCRKYFGKFHGGVLQSKMKSGLWYVNISGLPQSIEGEGSSPAIAIRDAISRNADMIKKLTQANEVLNSVVDSFAGVES